MSTGSAERVGRLNQLTEAADYVRYQMRLWSLETQALRSLQNDVSDFRANRAPMALRAAKQQFSGAHLNEQEWQAFRQTHTGNVDLTLLNRLAKAEQATDAWRGKEQSRKVTDQEPYLADNDNLKQMSLGVLEAEIARIKRLINIDTETAKRLRTVTSKVGDENAGLVRLKEALTDCEGAEERVKELRADREQAYFRIFEFNRGRGAGPL